MDKRWLPGFFALCLALIGLQSCMLFTAKSDFSVKNATGDNLVFTFTGVDAVDDATVAVAAGERVLVGSKVMMETDAVLPSMCYTAVIATLSGGAEVYRMTPIVDSAWVGLETGSKQFDYTLTVDAAALLAY